MLGVIFIQGCAAFPRKAILGLHVCSTSSQKTKESIKYLHHINFTSKINGPGSAAEPLKGQEETKATDTGSN